jgi:hypothetical protein
MVPVMRTSDELLGQPGGVFQRGRRGKLARRGRGLSRRDAVKKWARIKGQLMGENLGVSGEKSGERLKTTVTWCRGALLLVRRREGRGYRFGNE